MNDPLVSVIIPAYNAERFLRKTLESVQGQTYGDFEAIIVNDGSTDRTAEIAREFCQTDTRFTLISQDNRGVAAARNLAIERSRGDFIAPIDADDIWYPDKLEKQVRVMLSRGDSVGLVYTWTFIIDESDAVIRAFGSQDEGDIFLETIHFSVVGAASAPLYRRASLEKVGYYDPMFRDHDAGGFEDWDLEVRTSRHYKIACVPEYLVGYRRVQTSMSSDLVAMRRAGVAVLDKIRRTYPDVPSALLRWKRSGFDFWWSAEFLKKGLFPQGISLLTSAIIRDPFRLLWPLSIGSSLRRHAVRLRHVLTSVGFRPKRDLTRETLIMYHRKSISSPDLYSRLDSFRFSRVKRRDAARKDHVRQTAVSPPA